MKHKHNDCCHDEQASNDCCQEEYTPIIGSQFPDIELEAYHEEKIKKVKISDYKGKWVALIFYPADFTFICPTELSDAADLYDKFQSEGAEILSLSTDTVFCHKAWHDTSDTIKKIKFPMLADPAAKVCSYLGTFLPDEGVTLRASFIVDPEGVIKAFEIHDNSIGRSIEELLRKVQAAKFVEEHGGEVCPAHWKPGEKTLKPGLDLVGKI